MYSFKVWLATLTTLFLLGVCAHAQNRIIHDGEYEFLRQQHGDKNNAFTW